MPTLFLSAPGRAAAQEPRTFSVRTIHKTGLAPDYAIASTQLSHIHAGMDVVVFARDIKEQLEGTLAGFTPTLKADNGWERYDLHLANRRLVPYSNPPKITRWAVAIV